MPNRIACSLIFLTLFTGCYKNHLYVQQECADASFLASSHVGTPDPRQEDPPHGQRILVAWRFPSNIFYEGLKLELTVRFWDQCEEVIVHELKHAWGNHAFNFFDQRILTYRIDVINMQGDIVETWEHHFWVKQVDLDRNNCSVSSQPRQGSVMETP